MFTVPAINKQQTARGNVDLETWHSFRIEAIRCGRSIADWLGELVGREVPHAGSKPPPWEP